MPRRMYTCCVTVNPHAQAWQSWHLKRGPPTHTRMNLVAESGLFLVESGSGPTLLHAGRGWQARKISENLELQGEFIKRNFFTQV